MKRFFFLGLALTLLSACNKESEKKVKNEIMGINLDMSKVEFLKKYASGLSNCMNTTVNESTCTWEKGVQYFTVVGFLNEKIAVMIMPTEKFTLAEYVGKLRAAGSQVEIENVKWGSPVDSDQIELIKRGSIKLLGDPKINVGDYLSYGCDAIVEQQSGKLKYKGNPGGGRMIKECSDEVLSSLVTDQVMYFSNDYLNLNKHNGT